MKVGDHAILTRSPNFPKEVGKLVRVGRRLGIVDCHDKKTGRIIESGAGREITSLGSPFVCPCPTGTDAALEAWLTPLLKVGIKTERDEEVAA